MESYSFLTSIGAFTAVAENHQLTALIYKESAAFSTNNAVLLETEKQLNEYLSGKRRSFSLPLHLKGTDFQKDVWKALINIPYGDTVSYEAIADAIGRPKAQRAVGTAVGANPIPLIIPCHRVIKKNGDFGNFGLGKALKAKLLTMETE